MEFTKTLTMSDIESKLVVPNDMFGEILSPNNSTNGTEATNFFVRNQNGLTWNFRLSCIRDHSSSRYKLVVSAGWLSFARGSKLKVGDYLSIFKECGNYSFGDRVSFRIEVMRPSETKTHKGRGSHKEWIKIV